MKSAEELSQLQADVDSVQWFHTIDLGDGLVTKGFSAPTVLEKDLPDFTGKSVIDIGAWDGKYSFLAERGGASRVVALDHYSWGVDIAARSAYWSECQAKGILPDQDRDTNDFWQPDLPGQRGFNLAKQILNSSVETVVADFTTVDLDSLGTFDITMYFGVLYHMKEPLTCLERVRQITKEFALIETVAMTIPLGPGFEHMPLLRFHPGAELGDTDFGNWFVTNLEALVGLCRAAGFSKVEVIQGPPGPVSIVQEPEELTQRLRRAVRNVPASLTVASPAGIDYRALVKAYV